jgi:hypothetical protein
MEKIVKRPNPHRQRDDRGDADVLALMVIVPFVLGFVLLVSFWGRQSESAQRVTHAASVGARAAAFARDPGAAQRDVAALISQTLVDAGTSCVGGPRVAATATKWAPGGIVTVSVECTVGSGDLARINAPSRVFRATAKAVIDTNRGYRS